MEDYSTLTRLNICSFFKCLLHLWHAKVTSVLRVLIGEASHERFTQFFFSLQHSLGLLNRSLLLLSVHYVSLSCVLDSTF
jgi:hypothetical protein